MTGKNNYHQIQPHSWLNELPNWAFLTSKDLLSIFDFKTVKSVHAAIEDKIFPEPDKKTIISGIRKPTFYWTVKTIKKEIKRREKILSERKKCI